MLLSIAARALMAIEWNETFATHDQRIDEQHQQIFRFANRLETLAKQSSVDPQEVDALLRFLDSYVQSHFRYEEACMLKRRCPVAQRNRSEHLAFKAYLVRAFATYRAEGYRQDWALALSDRIQAWLSTHICRVDIQLRERPDGQRPEPPTESGDQADADSETRGSDASRSRRS